MMRTEIPAVDVGSCRLEPHVQRIMRTPHERLVEQTERDAALVGHHHQPESCTAEQT